MSRGWLIEEQTPGYQTRWRVRQVLHEEQTPFQHLQVVELEDFGRALVLDGCVQTTVGDEYVYHEMMVHVPLLTHPNPRRVLVIGGGDGGTVREVLRHATVHSVEMVEIDQSVVNACRRWLPETSLMLDDSRVRLVIGDGVEWISRYQSAYDVILVDSSDPAGPAAGLFNREFYEHLHAALKPGGLFVCQTLSPFFHQELIQDVHEVVADLFPITLPYLAVIPTYPSGLHCFTLGSKQYHPLRQGVRTPAFQGRWYTSEVHRAAFALPPQVSGLLRRKAGSDRVSRHG